MCKRKRKKFNLSSFYQQNKHESINVSLLRNWRFESIAELQEEICRIVKGENGKANERANQTSNGAYKTDNEK